MEHLLSLIICTLLLVRSAEGFVVPIAYVQSAAQKGAIWLDGSPPTYHFDKGFDAGIDNCRDTPLGSSKKMDTSLSFSFFF
ncbi:unnamed protein product [Lathyrus oleraceus]